MMTNDETIMQKQEMCVCDSSSGRHLQLQQIYLNNWFLFY